MTEKKEFTHSDRILFWGFGLFVSLFSLAVLFLTRAPLPPELWTDVAIAAGIRPPATPFPLIWHQLVSCLISVVGLKSAIFILQILGSVASGFFAIFAIRIFSRFIPSALLHWIAPLRSGRILIRLILVEGAALFVFSNPVWSCARAFSPDAFRLLLTMIMIWLSLRALENVCARSVIVAGVVTALVASESLLGIVSFVIFASLIAFRVRRYETEEEQQIDALTRIFCVRWFVTTVLFAFLGFVGLNLYYFHTQGISQAGLLFGFFDYFCHYLRTLIQVGSPLGYLILCSVVVVPAMFTFFMRTRAVDLTSGVVFRANFYFILLALLLTMQSLDWNTAWFWTWGGSATVMCSPYVLCLLLMVTSLIASFATCALTIELFFRNYSRIESMATSLLPEEAQFFATKRNHAPSRPVQRACQILFSTVLVALLVGLVALKASSPEIEAAKIVTEAAELTAEECGDVQFLFTDGSLDAAVECAARMQKRPVNALSFLSRKNDYESALRTRGVKNLEARATLEVGAAEALRTWVRALNPPVKDYAIQLGFEAWIQNQKTLPLCGGLVMRTRPHDQATREKFIKRAQDLAKRLIDFRENSQWTKETNVYLHHMISHLQFRLSRFCQLRANEATARNDKRARDYEMNLADRLDALNPEVRDIREHIRRCDRDSAMNLTPQEGLDVGFFLHDLRFARFYAEKVIVFEPLNFKANYALGMGAFADGDFARAETFLSACLKVRPNDAIVMNNLAVVFLRLGNLAEAEKFAKRANQLAPNKPDVEKTLADINKQKKNSEKEKENLNNQSKGESNNEH